MGKKSLLFLDLASTTVFVQSTSDSIKDSQQGNALPKCNLDRWYYSIRLLIAMVVLLITIPIKAQTLETVTKPYGSGYSMIVIKPTLNNFITLVGLTGSQFESIMRKYNYFEQEGSGGKYISFWNGSLDNYTYAQCVNTYNYNVMRSEVRLFVLIDMVYPNNAITDLLQDLRPYYKKSGFGATGNHIDVFVFRRNSNTYEFYVTSYNNMYDITVLKK